MTGANRRKGHDTERTVARWLRTQGFPDACTTRSKLGSDGTHTPGDIDFEPGICLEVKDVAQSAWPSWRSQTVAEAQGRVPIVLRRTRGVADVGQWLCHVGDFGHFLVDWRGWTADDLRWCRRTDRWWVEVPFARVVEVLRQQREAA